jgi:hypothetical protein
LFIYLFLFYFFNIKVLFFVTQRIQNPTGGEQLKRVPSLQVYSHLNKQETPQSLLPLKTNLTVRQQLEQINVINFYPLVDLTDDQIKSYLDSTPNGKLLTK